MSDDHKEALAEGRQQGRAVREYLEALEQHKPRRGRKRTPESIERQLAKIEGELASADPMKKLLLIQDRIDLTSELSSFGETVDITALEDAFVGSAAAYSERKGISYAAWRELGVDAAILKRANISRAS